MSKIALAAEDNEPKHEKVVETSQLADGTDEITTKSYYEQLAFKLVEHEKQVMTSLEAMLKDVLEALAPINQGSPRVAIVLEPKPNGSIRMVKRWTVSREKYPRQPKEPFNDK